MLNAIFAAALVALSVGESHSLKIDDRTEVKIMLLKDAVQINWTCAESNMEFVNSHYKNARLRWDVFKGEAVECTFSPFGAETSKTMAFPSYRLLTNPSNVFFAAFLGKPRPSAAFQSKTVRGAKDWTVEWVIPFAALETSKFHDAASTVTYAPRVCWTFKFSRRSETAGKKTVNASPLVTIKFPADIIASCRRILLVGYQGNKAKQAGVSVISGALRNTEDTEFTGKVKIYLHAGNEISLLKEIDIKIPAKGALRFDQPVTLPEKAVKFKIRTVIEDSAGVPVRISRDLPIENPWVEF